MNTAPVLPGRRMIVAALIIILVNLGMVITLAHFHWFGRVIAVVGAIFAGLVIMVRKDAADTPIWFVVLVALAVQLPHLFFDPRTSDDAYRYIWDGRVLLAGIDPYRFVPLDPALAHLRDPLLFPEGEPPLINRPGVPTIYPPIAQLWFAAVAFLTPPALGTLGVQTVAAGAVVLTSWLLARFLGERSGWALLYGACPAVALEAANGAHLDAIAGLCGFGLGWAAVRRRHWVAGVFLGLAGGIKLVPLLLIPAFLRHGRWRTSLMGIGVVAASYLPHLLAVGVLVFGFLPGYWREEGYDGGRRFALLGWLPEHWRMPVALVLAASCAVLAIVRSTREPVLVTCCWLYGCAFLIATPIYAWYALPFVVLVIMAGRLEWLSVWAALYVAFVFDHETWVQALAFGAALAMVAIVGSIRWSRTRRDGRAQEMPSHPVSAAISRH
jgi:Glycosyltransferase family 87